MKKLWAIILAVFTSFSLSAETCYTMYGGQTINVGSLCISNDDNNMIVNYSTSDQWLLSEVHFFVGMSLDTMPQTKKGSPKIGQFPYTQESINTNFYQLTIPLSELGSPACGTDMVLAAHASVESNSEDGGGQQETAWSEGDRILEKGNWATYSNYTITCDGGTGGPKKSCETAFAVGDTTFIDLGLTNGRWGWEITNVLPGNYEYPIYAGAGQNDLTKGTHVGNLNVSYDGSAVIVTYSMFPGFVMEETHLYVGTSHITTISPGQYGNIHELDDSGSDTYTINGFSGEPVFIVAHAVSCSIE